MAERGRLTRTVRFRVTALAVVMTAVVLSLTAIVLVTVQRRTLTSQLDESMATAVSAIADRLASGDELSLPLAGFGDDDSVLQVLDEDVAVVAATDNVAGRDLPVVPIVHASGTTTTRSDLPHDDARFRVRVREVDTPDGRMTIIAAASLDDIDESVETLLASLLVAVPVVVVLLGALVWWLVGRTLRPVDAIRSEVASITGTDLHRRVPEPGTGDEIDRLAHTMNGMLDRVERASHRQQQFVADASHELRSPLTRIRSELEVDLAHPASADLAATHRSVLEEALGLQHLVDDLLLLARTDADAPLARADVVDLDDVARMAVRAVPSADGISVDTSALGTAQVHGDASQLGRAVTNVVENAIRHANAAVHLGLEVRGDDAVLTVTDDGPGVPEEDRERVFERFTRLDDARTRSTGGTGLGLAIAKEIVERHGGSIGMNGSVETGATVVIELPIAE
jgi:signal transduction histidine kinase